MLDEQVLLEFITDNKSRGENKMKVSVLLTIAAIYAAVAGLALLIVPDVVLGGILGPTAPAALVGNLRGYGGVLIAFAVIDWVARNSDASKARDAILLGNFVGFLLLTITGIIRVLAGSPSLGVITLVINAALAVGFLVVGKANMTPKTN